MFPNIVKFLPMTTFPFIDVSPATFNVVRLPVGIVAVPVKVGEISLAYLEINDEPPSNIV